MDNLERESTGNRTALATAGPIRHSSSHMMERPSPYWKGECSTVLVHSFDE